MKRTLPVLLLPLAVVGCDAMGAHTEVVARAGQYELTVDETVEILQANPRIAPTTEVVSSVADLWLDYILLADLLARDPSLAGVNMDPLLEPYFEQRIFMELRDQVVTQDTVIGDDELRQRFEQEAPGQRVRARHILISMPEDPTPAQRDSIYALAEEIRQRAAGGEDFAELARRYSDDPGSGPQGGDLGWFEPGSMVRPFEEVAFQLQPGEISPVTETLFGLHVIRVEERETPAFAEYEEDFRQFVVQQRQQESLTAYVESVIEPVQMTVTKGAMDVARDLAERPMARLAPRAAARELVTWRDGSLTAGEFVTFIRRLPPQQRAQFAMVPEIQLQSVLEDVATNQIVLDDARRRGITIPAAERDSIAGLMREQILEMAAETGLTGAPQDGESRTEAVERRVRSIMEGILTGRHGPLPLGGMPYVLRQQTDWQVNERTFPTVASRAEERREAREATSVQPESPVPQPAPGQAPGPEAVRPAEPGAEIDDG
jgi:hypothetical protein